MAWPFGIVTSSAASSASVTSWKEISTTVIVRQTRRVALAWLGRVRSRYAASTNARIDGFDHQSYSKKTFLIAGSIISLEKELVLY